MWIVPLVTASLLLSAITPNVNESCLAANAVWIVPLVTASLLPSAITPNVNEACFALSCVWISLVTPDKNPNSELLTSPFPPINEASNLLFASMVSCFASNALLICADVDGLVLLLDGALNVNVSCLPLTASATKAVVATCVVLVPDAAVGAAGVPVNVGSANGALVPSCDWIALVTPLT